MTKAFSQNNISNHCLWLFPGVYTVYIHICLQVRLLLFMITDWLVTLDCLYTVYVAVKLSSVWIS